MTRRLIAVCLLALWGAVLSAPAAAAFLPEPGCECGCDHSQGPCCCRRAAGSHSGEPRWRSKQDCAGGCCRHSAFFSYRVGAFIPAGRPGLAGKARALGAAALAASFQRAPRLFYYRLFERPPPVPAAFRH